MVMEGQLQPTIDALIAHYTAENGESPEYFLGSSWPHCFAQSLFIR
jgi:hypothetical protein